jgi:hypothetical protein
MMRSTAAMTTADLHAPGKPRCTMPAPLSPNGPNGRDPGGRFSAGNPGGSGNPFARQVAQLRSALLEAVTPDDVRTIVLALVKKARKGDLVAAREVLDRCIGRPTQPVDLDLGGETLLSQKSLEQMTDEELLTMAVESGIDVPAGFRLRYDQLRARQSEQRDTEQQADKAPDKKRTSRKTRRKTTSRRKPKKASPADAR